MIARRVVSGLVRATARQVLRPGVPLPIQRVVADATGFLAPMPRGAAPDPERAVLFLHGGAFITGSSRSHRLLAARLGLAAGTPVHVPDYRRAPEHPYPAALDDVHAAYLALLDDGLAPERIGVAGDSAGAQLALALTLRLRDRGEPLPAGLALISPLTDLTLSDERVRTNTTDALLRPEWVAFGADAYAGVRDRTAPELSPLLADLAGLPPLLVHVGGEETLLADSLRLVERVRGAGGTAQLRVLEGWFHDAHLLAGFLREPTEAVEELGAFLRQVTTGSADTSRRSPARG